MARSDHDLAPPGREVAAPPDGTAAIVTTLLGVVIANGLSSENRVFATLLSERDDRYVARVLMHEADRDGTAQRFSELAANPVTSYDTGWRPSPYLRRRNPLRLRTAINYRRRIEAVLADARADAPDVVYSSQQHYDCRTVSNISQQTGVPQIIHLHYNIGPWLRTDVLNRLRTTDRVIAVSDFVRDQAIEHGVDPARVETLHNAVAPFPPADPDHSAALRAELGVPQGAFVFGMVGRIDEGKGHLDAIAALERMAHDGDEARLVIVGSGRIGREVRARAEASNVADRIVHTGFRTDVEDLLGAFDALLHPALEDPCPLAVLEAMAAGLPVIAYDNGGVPELVESGVTGILVPRDDVLGLAEAMRTVGGDRSAAQTLGAAGLDRLTSQFTPKRAGTRFAEIVDAFG